MKREAWLGATNGVTRSRAQIAFSGSAMIEFLPVVPSHHIYPESVMGGMSISTVPKC